MTLSSFAPQRVAALKVASVNTWTVRPGLVTPDTQLAPPPGAPVVPGLGQPTRLFATPRVLHQLLGTVLAVQTLHGLNTGTYRVTTGNGTFHVIDLDLYIALRYGAPGRAWTHESSPDGAADGEPFHFTRISDATVGSRMRLDYKGGFLDTDYWRLTSRVASIEPFTFDLTSVETIWGLTPAELALYLELDPTDLTTAPSLKYRLRLIDLLVATEIITSMATPHSTTTVMVRRQVPALEGESLLDLLRSGDFATLYAGATAIRDTSPSSPR